jgi:hypothetical protein
MNSLKKITIIAILLLCLSFTEIYSYPLIASETKNNITVDWYLARDGISKIEYIVNITSHNNLNKNINISSVIKPHDYYPQNIKKVKLYEQKQQNNKTILSQSLPKFKDTTKQHKTNYKQLKINTNETKTFRLSFNVPIIKEHNSYGSTSEVYFLLNGIKYHPWLNISWFHRSYIQDLTSPVNTHIKRIHFDTRTLHMTKRLGKEDCTDIRITDLNDVELEYNLIDGCLTRNTILDIETLGNTTGYYIYYGNTLANNVSNDSILFDEISPFDVQDFSIYGNTGTGNNNPTWNYNSTTSQNYIEFDGIDDYITTNVNVSSQEITACARITTNEANEKDGILVALEYRFHFWINPAGTFNYGAWTNDSNEEFTSSNVHNFGVSNHVCVVNVGGDSSTLYVNGEFDDNNSLTGDLVYTTLFEMGRHVSHNFGYFNGSIDEIKVFSRTLSESEIIELNNSGTVANETGLVLDMSFDEYYPRYEEDYQQYSPLYASKEEFKDIDNLEYLSPFGTLIYSIDLSLGLDDNICTNNNFSLETDTFLINGTVEKICSNTIFGYICTPSKKWTVSVYDYVNTSRLIHERIFYDMLDLSYSEVEFGVNTLLEGLGKISEIEENLFMKGYLTKSYNYIRNPNQLSVLHEGDIEKFTLSLPQMIVFNSSCTNKNNVVIRYLDEESIKGTPFGLLTTGEGSKGFFSSIREYVIGSVSFMLSIIVYSLSLLKFFVTHIRLTFLLFELFVLVYSIKATETISGFIREFAKAHYNMLTLLPRLILFIYDFFLRLLNTIINAIPFI